MSMAQKQTLDFTNVKEGGAQFSKKRVPAGDYLGTIVRWEMAEVKKGDNKGKKQWLYAIAIKGRHGAIYPYYCQLEEAQLWKIRNLLVAAGKNVPKKRVQVDPEIVVGKDVGMTLDDTEYDGKEQSEITAVFPPSELQGDAKAGVDEDDDDEDEDEDEATSSSDEDEDEDEPEPTPKKKKKASPPPDDDEDEDTDELDIDDP
jgi:hypothetical protein